MEMFARLLDGFWSVTIIAVGLVTTTLLYRTLADYTTTNEKKRRRSIFATQNHPVMKVKKIDQTGLDKRKDERLMVDGFVAEVTCGGTTCVATLQNLSWFGLCLKGISEGVDVTGKLVSVVLSGQGRTFTLKGKACWKRNDDQGRTVGLELENFSFDWPEFVVASQKKHVMPAPLGGAM